MKKCITLVLILICGLSFVSCSSDTIKGIDNANKIEVVQYDKLNGDEVDTATVTEETVIKHIVDNLNSLKFKKINYNEPTVLEYKLTFFNADGETIEIIYIPANDWVDFDGSFHSISNGELDRTYIAGLFE